MHIVNLHFSSEQLSDLSENANQNCCSPHARVIDEITVHYQTMCCAFVVGNFRSSVAILFVTVYKEPRYFEFLLFCFCAFERASLIGLPLI